MKTLNFSCLEILSALLYKSKTQTIRPTWETKILDKNYKCGECGREGQLEGEYEKPPRFKVGDKVKIFWKQRSKDEWFCPICGNNSEATRTSLICINCKKYITPFNKHLGTVEITEVFKIEMGKDKVAWYSNAQGVSDVKDLAKRDGFSSAEQMFKFFNKIYDLDSSKNFWVYRWNWL